MMYKCWQRIWLAAASALLPFCAAAGDTNYGDTARRILSDKEFTGANERSALAEKIDEILRSIFDWLSKRFGGSDASAATSVSSVGKIISILLVGAAIVLAVWALLRFWPRRDVDTKTDEIEDVRKAPKSRLLALAEQAELDGDLSLAFTLYFWSLLKTADEYALLNYSDDKTNWEVYVTRGVEPGETFWNGVRACGLKFDEIEYGGRGADVQDVAAVKSLLTQIQEARAA